MMRGLPLAFAFGLASLAVAAEDGGPSFDCKRASTAVEKAICSDPELSGLDRYLDGHYRGAQQATGEGAVCVRREQRRWVRERNACGSDTACLKSRYLERLSALNGLQPGARYITSLEFPPVPSLVAAIAPKKGDETGAAGPEVEYRGALIHETKDLWNMGIAIKSADGNAHALLLDMDLDGTGPHHALESAMKASRGATFLARGYAGEKGAFAMSRCRFVYRLPQE